MRKQNNFLENTREFSASALGYAITFLFLVGMVCTGVLFISSVNKRLELNYNMKEHIIMDNYLSLQIGASIENKGSKLIAHPSGDTTLLTVKLWGSFKVIVAKTKHNKQQIKKSVLLGYKLREVLPVLYLSDNNQALKLVGDTKIEGIAYLPERGLERGYIAGKNYLNEKLLYGEQRVSKKTVPKLKFQYENLTLESFIKDTKKIKGISKDTVFDFDQPTALYTSIEPIYLSNVLKGNLIVHSFDSIFVSNKCKLENVILISPKIRFEKGFVGSVQVIAHEQIICEENVRLTYPSTLILNELKINLESENRGVILKRNTHVRGGVLLVSQASNLKKPIQLKMELNSLISGLVYNTGNTEIKGRIIGHLYTNSFRLIEGGGEYTNHLLDVLISSDRLPEDFIVPNWLENSEIGKFEFISCF
jgi:hypothetical protein